MSFTVVSTFAGCGGSSLGYKMVGGDVRLAVEWDDNAAQTYRLNFPNTPIYHEDIAKLSVEEALDMANLESGQLDILDGSPPCQGFSTAGKRQFHDSRNQLFVEYVRLLDGFKPKAFVMENVSGMVKGKMKLLFAEILRTLKSTGYRVSARLLNAMYFGVPQNRQRLIFVGVREDVGIEPSHPKAQTLPICVRQAFSRLTRHDQREANITLLRESRWRETRPGYSHHQRFSLNRLAWNKVAPTILKVSGSGGHMHPDEPRLLSVGELRRLASFPDDFQFVGNWQLAVNRIGNSVPPLMAKAIAEHIRDNIFTKLTILESTEEEHDFTERYGSGT